MSEQFESHTLQKQFETLQEQKQKKLTKRKQLQEEQKKQKSEKTSAGPEKTTPKSYDFDEDDLNLQLADIQAPSIYSEDMVGKLNDQIRTLKDENGRLHKLVREKDFEMRSLRQKTDELSKLEGMNFSDAHSSKLTEQAAKIRHLTSQMESQKTKNVQLGRKVAELEQKLKNAPEDGGQKSSRAGSSERGDAENKDPDVIIKGLQKRLNQAEIKISEFRNQSESLKNQLKLAHKVLEQEVGEGATVQSLVATPTSTAVAAPAWKGRAHQITMLQKKVGELKAQLDMNKSAPSTAGAFDDDLEAEFMGSASSTSSRNRVTDRQKAEIRRMERERKEKQEKLKSENKALEMDLEALKKKFDASKVRNKELSQDLKKFKQEADELKGLRIKDDQLMTVLYAKVNQLEGKLSERQDSERHNQSEREDTLRQLALRSQQDSNIVDQLKSIVAEREVKVKLLEEEVHNLRQASLQRTGTEMYNPQRETSDVGTSAPASARTVMFDDCGSMTPQPSSRSASQQSHHSIHHQQPFHQHTPSSSPHPQLSARGMPPQSPHHQQQQHGVGAGMSAEETEELRRDAAEFKSLAQAVSVEKDKLTELVGVLQKRVEECTCEMTECQAEMAASKRKSVQLEKQLGKLKLEQGHSASINKRTMGSKVSMMSSTNFEDGLSPEEQLEEMETNLMIQKDENEALKAALQSTLKAKEDDMKLYQNMLAETKTIFLQGLRQFRNTSK